MANVCVTEMIGRARAGDRQSAESLLPLVYRELRSAAERAMSRERAGHTLQPTALVHEAYARLIGNDEVEWDHRGHFYCAAAEAMRRILIEHARARSRFKRGGPDRQQVSASLNVAELACCEDTDEILSLDAAFCRLSEQVPELADILRLRLFVGLSVEHTAGALGISQATVKRRWTYAKAWLEREMREG